MILNRRVGALLGVLTALLLMLAACGGDDDGAASDGGGGGASTTLSAIDNSFDPDEVSAPAGEEVTVEVTNDGENPHTFTSDEAGFDSGTIEPGDSAEVTFTMPDAETEFLCTIHGSAMSGTLVPEG
jgi:plastocyanin